MRNPARAGDDRGSTIVEVAIIMPMLVVPVLLMVLSVPGLIERQMAARTASQQAALAAVVHQDFHAGQVAAGHVASNHDLPAEAVTVDIGGSLDRDGAVTATVTVDMPIVDIPFLGGVAPVPVTRSHTERVSPYRSIDGAGHPEASR